MNYRNRCAFVLMAGTALMVGCSTPPSNRDFGTVLGGATGAIIGSQFGGGAGQTAATVIGAVAGAWVGSRIGAHLDEEDRRRLSEDSQRSASTGRPYSFYNSDTGVRGRTHVVQSETIDGQECRTVRQTISTREGRETYEDVRSCRGPNGWQVR